LSYYGTHTDTYEKARKKLKMAEVQSDLQTVTEDEESDGRGPDVVCRRSKRRRRYV